MRMHNLWRSLIIWGILVVVTGCQSAFYNTYPVPGENAGDGLKYYRSAFPRGERPDPWERRSETPVEAEREEDAEEETATRPSAKP